MIVATTDMRTMPRTLGDDLNLHLLRTDVVRNVFCGDRKRIRARRERVRNAQLAGACRGSCVPTQINRCRRPASELSKCVWKLSLQLE